MAGKVLYTAEAHVTGGRIEGHGRSSDGALEVDLRPPGTDGGTNPEQLFAVGYAACFEGAIAAVARREKVEPGEVSIDSEVDLKTNEDRSFSVGVRLNVSLPGITEPAEAVGAPGLPLLERHARQHRRRADRQRPAGRLSRPGRP
jgi:Ohr subfamily peroxiredoxin